MSIVARSEAERADAHYVLTTSDYVCTIARRTDGALVLVRQYRPAVKCETLELPAGHIDAGETPVMAARKELLEETGYTSSEFHLLASMSPCTGRMGNRVWCFFADDVTLAEPSHGIEPGVETVLYSGSITELSRHPDFQNAQHIAALFLAVQQGYLSI